MKDIAFTVNGKECQCPASGSLTLLEYLRDELGLTGTKCGCGYGACGACTVLTDGKSCRACVTPVTRISGMQIETIEGLAHRGQLDPVQAAFLEHGAFQCGYCTPGMIMEVRGFLNALSGREPQHHEIEAALESHICRCGSYQRLYDAIRDAADRLGKGPRT